MRRIVIALLVLLLGAVLSGCGGDTQAKAATRLPDVTLAPLLPTGSAVQMRDLRGPVVINAWANWCKPCRRDLRFYQQFHVTHPGVRVLGVDTLDPASTKAIALLRQVGLTYPQVTDPSRKLGTRALPRLILVDKSGRIAYRGYVEIKSVAQLEGLVRKHLGVDL